MKEMDHPNILRTYEIFQDHENYYLIMELCKGGSVLSLIKKSDNFSEWHAMNIMKQLLSAVNYCHQKGFVHRDIKPENVLFVHEDIESQIKVIDFGISVKIENDIKMKQKAGTLLFIAPEVLTGNYDSKCDIWSCGVFLYMILSGEPPFYS